MFVTIAFTMRIGDRRRNHGDACSDFQIQIGGMVRSVEVGRLPWHESTLWKTNPVQSRNTEEAINATFRNENYREFTCSTTC